ncbi:MAG: hypothetical protein ABL914_08675 [Novosphingobium sp.]|uniref:hypothetical protein n=1 Tax=Novosphingobium sp. TaxID=1874826 RepID=UPI0032BE7E9D
MIQQNPKDWSQGFWGSEHPETAALRVQKDYVDTMVSLKRENMDRIYAYLTGLIEKAKDELALARGGGQSADGRRMALKQHVDEISAYLKAQALQVELPRTYPVPEGSNAPAHYVLEDVPLFFGRVKCVLDQWYDSHLLSLYDEVLMLVKPKGAKPAGTPAAS